MKRSMRQDPLNYAVAAPTGERIAIERFPDGGITLSVPGFPKTSWLEQVVILLILLSVIGGIGLFTFGRGRAMVMWRQLTRSPQGLLVCAIPIIGVFATIPIRIRQGGRRSVVGITPDVVYVDCWEGLVHRRIEVPRSNLLDVTVAISKRSSPHPRGIKLHFRRRIPVLFGRFCKKDEIYQILDVLKQAVATTQ